MKMKILVGMLMLLICAISVSAVAITANRGSTDAPVSTAVYNGTYGSVWFNCTAMINGTPDQSLDNVTFWTNFDGTWKNNQTLNATNNTALKINQTLPTTQGATYLWNCKIATNTSIYWANSTNVTLTVDTTAPTLTTTAGTSTVPNGSVLVAGALGGLFFTTTDTGGSTVDETASYGTVHNGSMIFGTTWSTQGEGLFEIDIDTDLNMDNVTGQTICANITLNDTVGNDRAIKYCVIWDNDPSNSYGSDFNYSAHGGTNLSVINVSDEGLFTRSDIVLNNTYGKVTMTDVNFTGYDMNFNQCEFAQDSIMCPTDMGLTSTSIALIFQETTGFSTEPILKKDDVEYAGTGISWGLGTNTYAATVTGFSTYTLTSSIIGGSGGAGGGAQSYAICGDGRCDSPIETPEGCAIDCGQAAIPVVNTPGGDGFVNLPVQPPVAGATEDKKGGIPEAAWWIGGTVLFLLLGLLAIVMLMPTKGSSKGRRKKRRH